MFRFTLSLAALGTLAVSLTGCCCHHLCGGGAPVCPPANPCAPYGASFGAAPAFGSPGCPSGNCGVYPSGAYFGPTAPVAAAAPTVYTTAAAVPLNPLPTY